MLANDHKKAKKQNPKHHDHESLLVIVCLLFRNNNLVFPNRLGQCRVGRVAGTAVAKRWESCGRRFPATARCCARFDLVLYPLGCLAIVHSQLNNKM